MIAMQVYIVTHQGATMNVISMIKPNDLRAFAGNFPTGIAVVTVRDSRGECFGITMNSVTTLSLTPPLVLICLDNKSNTLNALADSDYFCLHYLADDQENISNLFASKQENKFLTVDHSVSELGCAIIDGVVAHGECRVVNRYPGGDHTIVIGQIQTATVKGGNPLVYYRGSYAAVGPLQKIA